MLPFGHVRISSYPPVGWGESSFSVRGLSAEESIVIRTLPGLLPRGEEEFQVSPRKRGSMIACDTCHSSSPLTGLAWRDSRFGNDTKPRHPGHSAESPAHASGPRNLLGGDENSTCEAFRCSRFAGLS